MYIILSWVAVCHLVYKKKKKLARYTKWAKLVWSLRNKAKKLLCGYTAGPLYQVGKTHMFPPK